MCRACAGPGQGRTNYRSRSFLQGCAVMGVCSERSRLAGACEPAIADLAPVARSARGLRVQVRLARLGVAEHDGSTWAAASVCLLSSPKWSLAAARSNRTKRWRRLFFRRLLRRGRPPGAIVRAWCPKRSQRGRPVSKGNGMTRGDRRRNARREQLRGMLPRETVRVKAFRLGEALDWAAGQARARGFASVTVACEPTGPRWLQVQRL